MMKSSLSCKEEKDCGWRVDKVRLHWFPIGKSCSLYYT